MITEEMARVCVPPRGFLNSWVSYGWHATDCNLAYHILGGLLLLSQTLPSYLYVRLGAKTHGNIFGLVVGESTKSRKTTSLTLAQELADDVWGRATPVTVGPSSSAGLMDHMTSNPRCAILYEEFGEFLQAAAGGALSELKTTYTSIYDSGKVGRLLSTKRGRNGELVNDNRMVESPRLSIAGAVNQSFLEDFTVATDWTGGFLARFFLLYAHRERTYDLTERPQALYDIAKAKLSEFLDLGLAVGPCEGLDDDARKIWLAWNEQMKGLEVKERAHEHAVASIARAVPMAMKFALLLMWDIGGIRSTRDAPWKINSEAMWYACSIANLHVRSALTLLPALANTKDERDCRRIVRAVVRADGPLTLGQIMERGKLPMKRRAQELCESLCETGALTRVATLGQRSTRFGQGPGADALAKDPELGMVTPAAPTLAAHQGGNQGAQIIPFPHQPLGQENSGSIDLVGAGSALLDPLKE